MFFEGEYRTIGQVDVAPLKALIAGLAFDAWGAMADRQTTYVAHAKTNTIPLIYDVDMRHEGQTRLPLFDHFEQALAPAMTRIRDYFAPAHRAAASPPESGYFVRVILVKLAANGEVRSHTDGGPSLARAHRIHLPITTNDKVLFAVAGNVRHMPEGELCEINNRKPHAVRNGGGERIHAILDYVVPGEQIRDPDGLLVA